MIHLENNGYRPKDSRELVHKARFLCANLGELQLEYSRSK